MDDVIHISAEACAVLAQRFSVALDALQGKGTPLPQLKAVHVIAPAAVRPGEPVESAVEVEFDHVVGGLCSEGRPSGFSVWNASGMDCYKITLHGNRARLHFWEYFERLPEDTHVGYALGTNPYANITDARGLAIPAFAPVPIHPEREYFPFLTSWKTTGVVAAARPLGKIACPREGDFATTAKTSPEDAIPRGFINENANWVGKSGHAYFWTTLELKEPMTVNFMMGYDGPFRLWVNEKPVFDDLTATNPCVPDKGRRQIKLPAGCHRVTVAMDINDGKAWGFCVRYCRLRCGS